jgi:hypothetical protein
MFKFLVIFIALLVNWSESINVPLNLLQPIDCKTANITTIPNILPNPCKYIENITAILGNFTPSGQVITQQLLQSLFGDLKTKLIESFNSVRRLNVPLLKKFASKDPNGFNVTLMLFSNLAKNNNQLSLVDQANCQTTMNDLENLKNNLNSDGLVLDKQIFCLIAADLKKNLPVTIAMFMFKNGKSLSSLQQNEGANLNALKNLMSVIMMSHGNF